MPKTTSRSRNFCFTLNNYTVAQWDLLKSCECKYLVMGQEVGDSGTPHIQGYVEFAESVSFRTVKRRLGCPTVHLEKRRATAQAASDYCLKEDGEHFTKGTISRQGRRTDIESLLTDVKAESSELELYESHPMAMLRYGKGVLHYRSLYLRQKYKDVGMPEVLVFVGDTGTGKTRLAHAIDPDLYFVPTSSSGTIWFDGYTGQRTILIDDFYGWIKYGYLLRLLDRYQFSVQIKGGHTWKCWSRVIITSNKSPSEWYTKGLTPALNRRFATCLRFHADGSLSRYLGDDGKADGYMLAPGEPVVAVHDDVGTRFEVLDVEDVADDSDEEDMSCFVAQESVASQASTVVIPSQELDL